MGGSSCTRDQALFVFFFGGGSDSPVDGRSAFPLHVDAAPATGRFSLRARGEKMML